MALELTDEQAMLRDSARRFLTSEYDFTSRAKLLDDADASTRMWQRFADLGWIGACLPETQGGYGGPAEAAILMEEFGRRLVVEPLLETAIVGGALLAQLPENLSAPLVNELVSGTLQICLATAERHSHHSLAQISLAATQTADGWRLDGAKTMVSNGERADLIFVTARTSGTPGEREGVSLFRVDGAIHGLLRRNFRLHDGRGAAELKFDNCMVPGDALVGEVDHGLALVELAYDQANAALCAEAVGSADHVLGATIEYLKTRVQYGAPLATLQVLQHRIAEMFVATEQARVMARFATDALALPEEEGSARVSAARVAVDDYVGLVCRQAVQLHGGMGVSEELDIAHHLKRRLVASLGHGDTSHHLQRFAELSDHNCDS